MYEAGDAAHLAATLAHLADDAADRVRRVEQTGAIVRELSWEREGQRYVDLIEGLALDGLSSAGTGRTIDPAPIEERS
jgi:hypothetical protein